MASFIKVGTASSFAASIIFVVVNLAACETAILLRELGSKSCISRDYSIEVGQEPGDTRQTN